MLRCALAGYDIAAANWQASLSDKIAALQEADDLNVGQARQPAEQQAGLLGDAGVAVERWTQFDQDPDSHEGSVELHGRCGLHGAVVEGVRILELVEVQQTAFMQHASILTIGPNDVRIVGDKDE